MHVCVLAVALFTLTLVQSKEGRRTVMRALLLSNALVVLYGALQMLQMDPLAHFWKSEAFLGRIFSFLGHPNSLGQLIVLTAPFLVLAYVQARDRWIRIVVGILFLFNILVLFGTVSRSAMLGAGLMLLLCLPGLRGKMQKVDAKQGLAISLLLVLCITVGLLFFSQRFGQELSAGRSVAARQLMWSATIDMIADRPLGYGLETMAFVSPQFIGKEIYNYESLTTTVDRAHNEYLHTFWALGPLGIFSFLGLLITLALSSFRQITRDDSGFIRASMLGIIGFQVAVLFGFPSIATATIFWVLVGCLLGLLPQKKVSVRPWIQKLFAVLLIGCTCFTAVQSIQWISARMMHAVARMNASNALALHQQGILTFKHDREMLIETTEKHLRALENYTGEHRDDLITSLLTLNSLHKDLTEERDGMAYLLEAWLHALSSDPDLVAASLATAKTFLPTSIIYHRTAEHIASLLEDEEGQSTARQEIRNLLPKGYFEQGSEMRRILLKQHPWLQRL